MSMFVQVVSLLGAFLILIAYWGHQQNWMDSRKPLYNILNGVGGLMLAYVALFPFNAGFLILETIWAGLSFVALFKIVQGAKVK